MKTRYTYLLITLLVITCFSGCMPNWTKAIRYGKTIDGPFSETLSTEVQMGLIIVPVKLKGQTYRFLFDTGAMLSISEEIQEKYNFKTVSKGTLTDSDNNRQLVKYVQTDTLFMGKIPFIKQTAFVANFRNNPVIACLNIDGIIGSNLMRYCKWTIDYQNAEIVLFKGRDVPQSEETLSLPFALNRQFDQIVTLKLGKATLKNLKIDYGSNGSLTIKNSGLEVLKDHEIITETFAESGFTQSGLHGKKTISKREYAWADTLKSDNFWVKDVEIKTGKTGLIGGEILSRFVVTLDFDKKKAYFKPVANSAPNYNTFGFRLGYSEEDDFYIQAVLDNSPADEAGLSSGLRVLAINHLDFTRGSNFCDYIDLSNEQVHKVSLKYIDKNGNTKQTELERRFMY